VSVCLSALALAGAAPLDITVIHAARWLSPSADVAQALGSRPTECLKATNDAEQSYAIEVGRAAFRTPLTLGGQAARVGLSCDSCHESGRSNADFYFPGVSGGPGTASRATLLSSHPTIGIDHPKLIPDLTQPKDRLKVDQDVATHALEPFLHGLVTGEFNGAEPPPEVLAGLSAYVRALSPAACPAASREPLHAEDYVESARRVVRTAILGLDHNDPAVAAFLVEAARGELGMIYERYDQSNADETRAALHAADLELAAAAEAIRAGSPHARERLVVWLVKSPAWSAVVTRQEGQSLFNVARLR
jgi:hypothetical protein